MGVTCTDAHKINSNVASAKSGIGLEITTARGSKLASFPNAPIPRTTKVPREIKLLTERKPHIKNKAAAITRERMKRGRWR